jgi:Ca-activated chloride channel family protein
VDLSHLHFAHPLWLWGLAIIPLIGLIFFLFYQKQHAFHQLEKFIDRHLLPYLLFNQGNQKSAPWKFMLLWSIVWSCLTLALAGPRWSSREIETFSRDQSLVILLDLSESMNATDIKPSRLVRAKQKIEDLINLSKGVKIGLIAFAADPHMIAPLTDDKETIRHLLPSLETDLAYVQGSRLSSALEMAFNMLEAEPGRNKALLVISDGGFEDASAIKTTKKLAEKGMIIHVMGVGTVEGAFLQEHEGNMIKKNGRPIHSKLEKETLHEISKVGNGHYLEMHYSDQEEAMILKELEKRADTQMKQGQKHQLWDEHFYLFILPALPILLWWFRRGYLIAMLLILIPHITIEALPISNYFKNSEERGKQAMDNEDYETAVNTFQDPYRKGIAYYRAGQFVEAEKMFQQSSREEVAANAAYNLGNALAQQQKFKEAIAAYEDVLKKWPDHTKAKENLELIKQMLEQQTQQDSNSKDNSDQQEEHKPNESQRQNQNDNQDAPDSKGADIENQNTNERQDAHEAHDKEQQQENEGEQADENQKGEQEELQEEQPGEKSQGEIQEAKALKSQEDQDADLWLNQITNDPKTFLKNKFYIESKKNGTKEGIDPW